MIPAEALTRRSFIRKAAATGALLAAPQIVPSSVLGREGHTAPSERIRVGFIGIGQHGFDWNLPPYLAHKDAQVIAVCDVDRQRMQRAATFIDRRYGNTDCKQFPDFRELIARDDIDAVMISTPDHWHTQISTVCHIANIAIKLGRKLKWDPAAEQFTEDAEALALMDRPRRDPWLLPQVP